MSEHHPPDHTRTDDDLVAEMERATLEAELSAPDEGLSSSELWLNRLVEAFGVVILVAIVALILGNASSRYLVGRTYVWVDEIVLGMVPWLTMCGLFLSVRRREIIKIEFFLERWRPRFRNLVQLLADLISVVAFGYLGITAFQMVSMFGGDKSIYLKVQAGWFTSSMVIGSVLVALAFLLDAIHRVRQTGR